MCTEVQGEASVSGSKALQLDVVCLSQCWDLSLSFFLFLLVSYFSFFVTSFFLHINRPYVCLLLSCLSSLHCYVLLSISLSHCLSFFIFFFSYFQFIHPPLLLSFLLHCYPLCWIFFCLSLLATSPSVFVSSFHHLIPLFFLHCLHCFDLS